MPEFKPLKLNDKEIIEKLTKNFYVASSELCFTTFYIWRKLLKVSYAVIDNCVVFKTQHNCNPMSLRFPLGNGDKGKIITELTHMFGEQTRFYGLTEDMLEYFGDGFEISPMSDYSDYVYESERLISLSGKKLHSKRNHINAFNKLYNAEFSPITSADAHLIIQSYEGWYEDSGDEYLQQEKESIADIINNFNYLNLMGEKLTVGGRLVAFTIGEGLNADTAVVHIEKADTAYKGAYAVINQHFAENYLADFKYINREEDMGLLGLRKAKLSYCPVKMIEKYKAVKVR